MTRTLERFRLDGKIALVSGGAGIVGRPIVRALAEAGATVLCAGRDGEKCRRLAEELAREGCRVEGLACDFSDESALRALRDDILARHGRLDVLFNNAVARAGGDLRHATAAEWEESMRLNSTGLFLACQILSEPMQAQRSGSIVNIASIYGMVGPTFSIYAGSRITNPVNYAFAKGGMINLTRYLASYLAPYQVRVNCLSPGGFLSDGQDEVFRANYGRQVPLGRLATGEDIQGPAVFLASDASRYITGANIPVDGGWTAI
ncbi:MAG: SDR family oxidoreductase [Bryobacterales bacterium]|nr:SDR family oxidoreductase [Bryobacterales bacterium]